MKGGCKEHRENNEWICWGYLGSFCRITVVLRSFEFPFCFFFFPLHRSLISKFSLKIAEFSTNSPLSASRCRPLAVGPTLTVWYFFMLLLHFGKIPKKFGQIWRKFSNILAIFAKFWKKTAKNSAILNENFTIRERCKGVHCVDLGESFPTSIYLQKSASIQPRTSPSKFGGKIQFTIHFTP